MLKLSLFLGLLFTIAFAVDGVDFGVHEGVLSESQVQCLKEAGTEFMIMQLWRSNGLLNPYFTVNYETSMALGIQNISAYAFICPEVNTPEQICPGVVAALPIGFKGKVWLDIEPYKGCWTNNGTANLKFAEDVATACSKLDLDLGVYSTRGAWDVVFGSPNVTSTILNQLPLWYAYYDGKNTLGNDYQYHNFSGWTSAVMKQYAGLDWVCGATFDLNAY